MIRLGGVGLAALACTFALAACGDDGGGAGADHAPAVHALGRPAVFAHTATGEDGKPVRTTVAITVERVRKISMARLRRAGVRFDDPKYRDASPYFIDARYQNRGAATIERTLDISLEDTDGKRLPSTVLYSLDGSTLKGCEHVDEGTMATGEDYESCTLFLVPAGRTPGTVSFLPYDPGRSTDAVRWAIG